MRTLQLEPAQVRTATDFFEAYASHALSSGRADEEAGDASSSTYLLDAASSLRAAGQWAMLFDARRAARLLAAAAQIWQTLGYGFGTFVLAAVAPRQLDRRNTNDRLRQLAQQYTQDRAVPSISTQQVPEPMLHPQQQAYLLLACASLWRRFDLEPGLLRIIIDQSPHRRGVAPIGALGTPLRQYWDIARRFLDSSDEESARTVASDLARMAGAYAEAINSAMANERLWFNAAAPVDVGDIDIVAIALVSAGRLGPDLTKAHLRLAAESLDPTARIPLELASEMIDDVFPGPATQGGRSLAL
jgi:hypothetical protein